MKRFIVTVFVLVLGCAPAFAGGGKQQSQSGGGAAGKKPITFYTWWADAERAMGEAIVAEFEKANPNLRVEQNYVAYNDYHSKLNTVMASGVPADVFQLNEFLIKEWGSKDVIQDQRPYYLAAGINPEEFSLSSGTFSTGQKLWAISYGVTTIALFYNRDMLREAGITPPPEDVTKPWTWDQYIAAAKKLTKDANGRTPNDAGFNYDNLIQYGTVMPTSWIYVLPLLYTGNSSVANSTGTALEITSPTGIKIVQSIANLALVDKVAPTVAMTNTNAFSSLPTMLMNGQLGMFIGGTFQFPDFKNEGYDVGIAQIPSFSGRGDSMTLPGGFVLGKGAENDAFSLAYFISNYNNWVTASKSSKAALTQLPDTRSTYTDPALNAAWIAQFDANLAKVAGDIIQKACRPSESINLKNFSEIMDQTIAPVLDKVWLGSETAQQALPPLNQVLQGKLQGVWD
ncbi:MAG: sugar ABC transporter substrate-binding protein [Treponema sp.]|jgi:multiple sugar transport system substrate-binding protein|nr:sugar ABC transporter substrate-binding protein [Treponema sp.]